MVWSDLVGSVAQQVVTVLLIPVVGLAIAWIRKKTKQLDDDYVSNCMGMVKDIAYQAVSFLEQTKVKDMKKDNGGKLSEENKKILYGIACGIVRRQIPNYVLECFQKNNVDLESVITTAIEQAVLNINGNVL